MSKYLILGDLHCRTIWKDIVAKEGESCDKIIFLGDYIPPREVTLDDPTDACGFLYEVLDFKDKNPDKVILLRGNHDLQALGYYWAECWPKVHDKVAQYCRTEDVKNWFLKNTQWVYHISETNIVCSHAGISSKWQGYILANTLANNSPNIKSNSKTWEKLNQFEPSELFGFTDDNPFDTNGESKTQPCTWIRPQTLLDFGVNNIVHVVGHTPVSFISNIKTECLKYSSEDEVTIYSIQDAPDIWCCDCLANNQYLIIEDEKFKPCKL